MDKHSHHSGELLAAVQTLIRNFGLEVQQLEHHYTERRAAMDNLRNAQGLMTLAESHYHKWRTACVPATAASRQRLKPHADLLQVRTSALADALQQLSLSVGTFNTFLAAAEATYAILHTLGLHSSRAIRGNARKLWQARLEADAYPDFFAKVTQRCVQAAALIKNDLSS